MNQSNYIMLNLLLFAISGVQASTEVRQMADSSEAMGIRRELEDMKIDSYKERSWIEVLTIYMIIQAIVGILMFEWAYGRVAGFR